VAEELTSRTQRLRKKILDAPYEICVERARYYTESYKQTEGQDPALRAAKAFAHTLKNMTAYILDDEAIVGNRSGKLVASVIPIDRGDINVVLDLELDRVLNRSDRPFHISDDEKRELQEVILPYWDGKTVRDLKKKLWKENDMFFPVKVNAKSTLDRVKGFGVKGLYKQVAQSGGNRKLMARAGVEIAINNPGLCMNVFDTQGHLVVGHRNLINEGYEGAKKRAEARLAEVGDDPEKKAFLESVIICCEAARDFADRFAKLADEKAGEEGDPARKKELEQIAERCRRVPWQSPRDFREAVQWLWMSQNLALISYGLVSVFALGRVDQYLWPYLEKDLAEGRITEDEALTLLEELIIKLSYNLLVLPPFGKATGSELGADNMAVTIGGVGRDGEDAVNPLSRLFVKATENMSSMTNSISFRISEKNSDDWVERVVGVHRSSNGPSIFNDDAIVHALADSGYTIEDARDYAIIGCVEPTSDGNTFGCTSGNDISLVGALEMALHRGRLRMAGRRMGPDTGDPRKWKSFDEVMDAYKKQVSACIDLIAKGTELKDRAYAEILPCPLVSTTLKGCIENAIDMTRGGAQYNFNSISGRGMATAVDSLAAVKKLVFEDKAVSMGKLLKATDRNFKKDEKLQQMLKTRAPKFGSDDDYADDIAREVTEYFCKEVMAHKAWRGGIFRPSFFSYGMHVFEGTVLGATPDGRRAGEAVSNSLSPTNQSEKKGPVAALQSVAKINHRLIPNGSSTNIKFLPFMIESEAGLKKIAAMLRAYFKQGGQQVQFNVLSDETLRAAQKDPEAYKDLVVRVSGYSAYFVDLGKPVQDDIIARMAFDKV
jgi:formate C-acetyltransferase